MEPQAPPGSALDASEHDEGGRSGQSGKGHEPLPAGPEGRHDHLNTDRDHDDKETKNKAPVSGVPPPPPLAEADLQGATGLHGDPEDDGEVGLHGLPPPLAEADLHGAADLHGDQGPEDDEDDGAEEAEPEALAVDDADVPTDGDDEDDGAEEAEPEALAVDDADVPTDGDDEDDGAEEAEPGALAIDNADALADGDDEGDDEDDGAEEAEPEALANDDAHALSDGDDEVDGAEEAEPGALAVNGADAPTDGDSQEGDGDDDMLAVDTEPLIRAVAGAGLVAIVLGLGLAGALRFGVAATTTEPGPCGDHSNACHPWGATSTASASARPLVVPVPERLPLTTAAPTTATAWTDADLYPRVVSGAAEWAQQHHRGGTSSAVPPSTSTADDSEQQRRSAGRPPVLYFYVFVVVAMAVGAFQTMLR